jgi:hypothetical protein
MGKRLLSAVALGVWCGAAAAWAGPISGELSLNGSDTFTSTSVSFLGAGNVGGATGSFQTVFGVIPPEIFGGVTFTNFTTASSNFTLYNVVEGTSTSSLLAAMITSFVFTPGTPLESIDFKGTGTLTLAGAGGPYTNTAGNWELTSQGPGGTATVTFSETSIASGVPEPSSWFLLSTALIGLGALLGLRRAGRAERPAAHA